MSFIPGNSGQPAIAPSGITGTSSAPLTLPSGFSGVGQITSVLADADKVLVSTDNLRMSMSPTVTRNIVLPSSGVVQGSQVTVVNTSSTNTISVRITSVGGTVVKSVAAGAYATFVALVATPSLSTDWSIVEGRDISARSVVGDVSGTAVPAGYVGQEILGTTTSGVNINNVAGSAANIVLPAGIWLIRAKIHASQVGATGTSGSVLFNQIDSVSGTIATDNESFSFGVMAAGAWTTTNARFSCATKIVNISTATTFYLNAQNATLTGATGFTTVTTGAETVLKAIRIA